MPGFGSIGWGKGAFSGTPLAVSAVGAAFSDLSAIIRAMRIRDLPATLFSVIPVDLPAALASVPSVDLTAIMQTIPSVDLRAFGGGHFPEDISASMVITQPENMAAFIRGGFSQLKDLGASLTQAGSFEGISGFVKVFEEAFKDLPAKITSRVPKDLPASVRGWGAVDLTASLITQREAPKLLALIKGFAREVVKDLPAFLRRSDSDTKELPVQPLKARVSTHTSDKFPNLNKVSRIFFENVYAFGSKSKGFFILTLLPVFGIFPDLHAEIFAQQFFRFNMSAFIRVAEQQPFDLPTTLTAVTPYININKIKLSLIPLINLGATLNQVGAIKPLQGIIRPLHKAQTGRDADAGFITTATSYRFYLGTNKGLFIPPKINSTIRITTFRNNYPRPDLNAYIAGWVESNLGASIKPWPTLSLGATITATDLDHIKHLTATLVPSHPFDLSAAVTPSGGFIGLSGIITTDGFIEDFPANIIPFIDPLAFDIISVSTKPFTDLSAIINYGSIVVCSPTSSVKELSAYLRPLITGTPETVQDITAEIVSTSIIEGIQATITGRKRTRIRILTLNFRSKTRGSHPIGGIITPVIPSSLSLFAQITGLPHEFDLPATLTPIRLRPPKVPFTRSEELVNLKDPSSIKEVLLSFRSQVGTYVYEELTSAVYPTDRGTWVIDVRSATTEASFFDRSIGNREREVSNIEEFFSLDEAIRRALVLLCERRQYNISASLEARGAATNLSASISTISSDRIKDLSAAIGAAANSPDITASINTGKQSSTFLILMGVLVPSRPMNYNLTGDITGSVIGDLGAELVVV